MPNAFRTISSRRPEVPPEIVMAALLRPHPRGRAPSARDRPWMDSDVSRETSVRAQREKGALRRNRPSRAARTRDGDAGRHRGGSEATRPCARRAHKGLAGWDAQERSDLRLARSARVGSRVGAVSQRGRLWCPEFVGWRGRSVLWYASPRHRAKAGYHSRPQRRLVPAAGRPPELG